MKNCISLIVAIYALLGVVGCSKDLNEVNDNNQKTEQKATKSLRDNYLGVWAIHTPFDHEFSLLIEADEESSDGILLTGYFYQNSYKISRFDKNRFTVTRDGVEYDYGYFKYVDGVLFGNEGSGGTWYGTKVSQ